ncbi:MAG: hypothetical protein K2X66_05880 [Cyanobacteria bacterium]|nr:hypothetical protein [Cyanobacteriota bacterium]
MSLHFQGIFHLNGMIDAVDHETKLHTRDNCLYVQSTTETQQIDRILLTREDAVSFWADQGVAAQFKEKFSWFHPIRSFQAVRKERSTFNAMTARFYKNMENFKARVEAYAAKHPSVDVTGKPVVRERGLFMEFP